jgi:hypothetical protein
MIPIKYTNTYLISIGLVQEKQKHRSFALEEKMLD